MPSGGKNQQTARAGEYYVAAELNRRGAYAVTFSGNMPEVDVMASNADRTHTVYIQVKTNDVQAKTKKTGTWQLSKGKREGEQPPRKHHFWIFVTLSSSQEQHSQEQQPNYWIVPDEDMRSDIKKRVQEYVSDKGYRNLEHWLADGRSPHHNIQEQHVEQWKDCWDILEVVVTAQRP